MPCDSMSWQTEEQREAGRRKQKAAREALERALEARTATIKFDRMGRATFEGWTEKAGLHDDCTYRVLLAEGSSALRIAMARTQTRAEERMQTR